MRLALEALVSTIVGSRPHGGVGGSSREATEGGGMGTQAAVTEDPPLGAGSPLQTPRLRA